MTTTTPRPLRSLALYAVAVALPSLALGAMAYAALPPAQGLSAPSCDQTPDTYDRLFSECATLSPTPLVQRAPDVTLLPVCPTPTPTYTNPGPACIQLLGASGSLAHWDDGTVTFSTAALTQLTHGGVTYIWCGSSPICVEPAPSTDAHPRPTPALTPES